MTDFSIYNLKSRRIQMDTAAFIQTDISVYGLENLDLRQDGNAQNNNK